MIACLGAITGRQADSLQSAFVGKSASAGGWQECCSIVVNAETAIMLYEEFLEVVFQLRSWATPQFCLYIEMIHRVNVACSLCSNSDRPRFGPHLVFLSKYGSFMVNLCQSCYIPGNKGLQSNNTSAFTHLSDHLSFGLAAKHLWHFLAGSCAMLISECVHTFSVGSQLQSKRFR